MIIGLAGKAGSGKSTAAKYLKKHYNFHIDAYAKTMKEAISIIFRNTSWRYLY